MKVLITGCHGLLGQKVVAQTPTSDEVYGIDLQEASPILADGRYWCCDISHRENLSHVINVVKPDYIVNTAAYTNVDGAESERQLCWQANVTAVQNLVYCARKFNAKIVHISTDYIFDGIDGPYDENARPNPLGYYGRSKLAAENVLLASPVHFAIVRTMVLYGLDRFGRDNFVTWLIRKLAQQSKVTIVTDQIGNTTLADELAQAIWTVCQKEFRGIIHIAGRDIIDRYSFARHIARVFELNESLILPITTAELKQPAPRPLRSGLIINKAMETLGIHLSDSMEGLLKLKQQMP